MGSWYCFLFGHKTKAQYTKFEFYPAFSRDIAAFYSTVLEFSVIHQHVEPDVLIFCVLAAFAITLFVRSGRRLVSVKCFSEMSIIRHHRIEFMMAGFMIYFWAFSLIAGWYKPQFKREYQAVHYENVWYYIIARYDDRLVLSKSYRSGGKKFVIFNSGNINDFEINTVRVR